MKRTFPPSLRAKAAGGDPLAQFGITQKYSQNPAVADHRFHPHTAVRQPPTRCSECCAKPLDDTTSNWGSPGVEPVLGKTP